jgi:hypothetical protein
LLRGKHWKPVVDLRIFLPFAPGFRYLFRAQSLTGGE